MPKYATIDLGTNSVLLLIAEADGPGARPRILSDRAVITRVGEGVDKTRRLSEAPMARTLEALGRYAEEIRAAGVAGVKAAGTSALRDAENGAEFVAKASEAIGAPLEVVSGDREAELTYRSVCREFPGGEKIVIDIGGGSTEVIHGLGDAIRDKVSLDVGSVRLHERFVTQDPMSHAEYDKVNDAIMTALEGLPPIGDGARAFGVAGTVTTCAALAQELPAYERDKVHGFELEHYYLSMLQARLLTMPVSERIAAFPALDPKRADVIPIGAHLLQAILEHYQLGEVTVADLGVRWGLLYELIG